MLKVLFFASYRERLGTAELELPIDAEATTVADVISRLRARGEHWDEVLSNKNTLCAVNQELVRPEHRVKAGDEVAFFPPVTGG